MVDELEVIAGLKLFVARVELVDDDVVRTLEGRAGNELEAAFFTVAGAAPYTGHAVDGVEINALDRIEAADRLHHGAAGEDDAGLGRQHGNDLVGERGGGEADDGGAGGPDEDIGPDAAGTAGACVERAVGDADQRKNHGDFNADGQHRQQRADGAMGEIGEDELVDQGSSIEDGGRNRGGYLGRPVQGRRGRA